MTDKLNNPNPAEDQPDSDKLEAIIADYLDQLNSGKRLDPKEILARHPGYGHEILESLQEFINLVSKRFPSSVSCAIFVSSLK